MAMMNFYIAQYERYEYFKSNIRILFKLVISKLVHNIHIYFNAMNTTNGSKNEHQ